MNLKKTISVFLCLCMVLSAFAVVPLSAFAAEADIVETGASVELAETSAGIYGLADNVQDGQILQCWNWSYRNIAENMSKIAQQGFSAIQTSPIQATKETTKEYYNTVMNSSWVVYQPVAFNIETNDFNALGTKADFEYMCEVAHKYGVKVIVDAVLNHMANNMSGNTIHTWIPSELKDNSDCWHDISKDIYNYDNRYDVTHYCITGLPDLNTANSTVQKHCKNFLKEAIAAGADGFRFDAAKHIETDWDADGTKSDFWKNVLASATNYAQENRGITPYYYGEMLGSPGGGLSIEAYTQYMSVTDPGTSDYIRNGVCNGDAAAAASSGVSYGASKSKIVQWTESHDNHKDHGTNMISEHNINKTWAIVGARDEICGMYLARPKDMSTTMMGDADYTSWSYPEVKAVNDFKNYFIGQGEYLSSYNNLACVERGSTGIVIVNTGGTYYDDINVPVHTMKSGTYTDAITGNTFTVSGGYIKGDIGDTGIAVVYDVENRGVFTEGNVTEVSVAGSFNNWDTSADRMIAIDGNTVSTTMFLSKGTYEFKISTTTGMWYGNGGTIEDSTGSSGWTMKSSDDDNCTLNASGGKYTFKFNVSTGKLVVEYENTTDRASGFYLKGTMNEWDSSAPFVYADDSNTVTATVALSAGTYSFKINNEAEDIWYSNAGTINDTTGDTGWTMKVGLSDKCTLVATGGNYTFSFNLSTQKLTVATDAEVTTTTSVETDPSESSEVDTGTGFFLKGTFNDWNDSNPFVETAEADVVTTAIKLEAGTYTFKIHDSNTEKWRSNTGTINDKTNSSGWTMSSSVDDKCTLNASGGLYTFNFNTSTCKLVVLYTPDETDPTETTVATHKVTFKDYDGTVLSEQEVKDGESAKAPASPERAADAQYTYTFTGWDKDFTNVTEDITVTAIYSKTVNKYTVTFVDFDGTELYKVQVEYGSAATIPPVEPEREGYVFTGWDKAFDNITEDITVTAQYVDATVYLKGSFNDWGNTNPMLLSTDDSNVYTTTLELSEGTYTFKINYKESWYGNNGTFTDTTVTSSSGGWEMETGKENCTLKASGGTYTFKYDISTQKLIVLYTAPEYTVTFVDFDGSVIDTQTVKRGDSATAPATPTREGDAQYAYEFKEWDTDFTSIKADTIVTAIYTQTLNKYTVTFVDYDGTKLGAQQVEYGKSATAPDTPVREGYTFKGWDKAFDNVTENITVTATYTSNAKKIYSVFYVNADGTYLGFEQVEEGKAAAGIEAPTMAADAQYTYTFAGWDADLTAITADTIATAKYDTTVNKYTVTFTDKDGAVLDTQTVEYGAAATAPEAP
ncbi:MAG: InlB B-repeat-containing protein, partial [Ruminococcus sp.]|nr:InlB B-repeat-containing protein [Ruminococcus sp.]